MAIVRPISDVSNTWGDDGGSPLADLFAVLDEESADAVYAFSGISLGLGFTVDPVGIVQLAPFVGEIDTAEDVNVHFRAAVYDDVSGGGGQLFISVFDGETEITSRRHYAGTMSNQGGITVLTESFTDVSFALTTEEKALITDPTDLRIRLQGRNRDSGPGDFTLINAVLVDQVWLEASIVVPEGAPVVEVVTPAGGRYGFPVFVRWEAEDGIEYYGEISDDGGETWTELFDWLEDDHYEWEGPGDEGEYEVRITGREVDDTAIMGNPTESGLFTIVDGDLIVGRVELPPELFGLPGKRKKVHKVEVQANLREGRRVLTTVNFDNEADADEVVMVGEDAADGDFTSYRTDIAAQGFRESLVFEESEATAEPFTLLGVVVRAYDTGRE